MNKIDKYKEIMNDFELKVGEIKSGDVIILKYPGILSQNTINNIRDSLKDIRLFV